MFRSPRRLLWAGAAACGIAALAIIVFAGGGHVRRFHVVTVTLGGPGHEKVPLAPPAQAIANVQAKQGESGHVQAAHSMLRAEPPQAASQAVVEADKALTPLGQPVIPAHIPLAAVHEAGCRTLLVRNYSARSGAPILLGVLHQTISPDSGWNGVLANVHWFDTPAAQASSNYIVSRAGGQCAYIVPETSKAWAQAGFNRVALSVEVTETGNEGSYLVGAGRAKVIQLMRDWHQRWHIPYRHGRVSGCSVVRSGFVEHADLGACGGGHHDDQPYSIDPLIKAAAGSDITFRQINAVDRRTCGRLNWWRTHGRPHGKPERNAVRRHHALAGRGVACTARGPIRS